METLSRYLYATGPIEMANQLCEMKIERDNQLLFKRGRRVEERGHGTRGFGFLEARKTSAQEAADVRLCSIDQLLTKSIQEQNRKVCEKVPAEKASQIIRMKIDTISKIIIKRAEVTKAVDKALREGKSVDDAIGSYSNETTILCNTFLDAASKMLKESGKRKKEEYFMVPIRARTQYAFVRALLSVEAAFHGELDQPFYPPKEISKNQLFIYKDVRGRVGDYEKMMRVEDRKTRKQVEKLLRDDPKARVEPLLFEYQQFLFELVEKAKKEGLEWKNKWDDAALKKEAEIKEKVTVEKEKEGEKEEKALEKKEEVLSKDEMKVENEKVMEEEVPTKQIAELKSMMTVMKEEMLQEFNK
uniref:Rubis-subs-bind domain-containing protein n=1 Tax=Caenorhabditis tropicalis TaxID=1561998 RepID=A0A1I7UHC9_9PELO